MNHWNGYGSPPRDPWSNYDSQRPNNAGQTLAQYGSQPQNQNYGGLDGRIVESPRDITPDEVPLNGSLAVFPLRDLSVIYAKAWTDQGIVTARYIPEKRVTESAPNTAVIPDEFRNAIFERLDKIEQALTTPPKAVTSKKEAKTDG